jgi:hypothetical protein
MNSLEGLALLQLHNVMGRWELPSTNDWARVLATFSIFEGVSKRRLRKLVRGARSPRSLPAIGSGRTAATRCT